MQSQQHRLYVATTENGLDSFNDGLQKSRRMKDGTLSFPFQEVA
jgi:hypothetical protein